MTAIHSKVFSNYIKAKEFKEDQKEFKEKRHFLFGNLKADSNAVTKMIR